MKHVITSLVLLLISTGALAHSGGHTLVCKSAMNSGSNQVIEFYLHRANYSEDYAPEISVTINGQKHILPTPHESKPYGQTFHNSPLGVITVTANNYYENKVNLWGGFSVVAIPNTVTAFDTDGKAVKWDFEAEKDECNDRNGSAKFKGIFHGDLRNKKSDIPIDTQILDCELTYSSGMAC
ncbi:hypothetical protein [Bdellovibrio sp. HCB337]|uniref:hypothetical protein n=1 Tax=Bdellovibrio sp. HCB337 TaxID=3394358 RepID=UPI0039A586AD